ncbi:EamA family transporter [Paraglaciecola aquimarina]|uniref:EamA family transporter n=1 Tax=Paraglaciecola aquimarina TaxID=1235557 RepID=A0ABU3T267_9ALTE|nr:EamA family transporter [Paraglaciecola aquimarina]MDU0356362.1 EamA family transporter [Paraglaciecola aquimarina]
MSALILALILVSISLSVIAQILLKHGMSNPIVQASFKLDLFNTVFTTLTNISVLAGLIAYVSSAGIWLVVLSKIDVSKAYPFVGLGFIGTMLFAHWFLNEPLTTVKVVGTVLIVAGVLLISSN